MARSTSAEVTPTIDVEMHGNRLTTTTSWTREFSLRPILLFSVTSVGLLLGMIAAMDRGESRSAEGTVEAAVALRSPSTTSAELPPTSIAVEVVGHDFVWTFRLPGPDGEFATADDIRVGDELRLPVDCNVSLQLTSGDYVYIFSARSLGLREIAVPELTHHLQFHTAEIGAFDVLADPLCGVRLFHPEHMGRIIIQPRHEFHGWVEVPDSMQR